MENAQWVWFKNNPSQNSFCDILLNFTEDCTNVDQDHEDSFFVAPNNKTIELMAWGHTGGFEALKTQSRVHDSNSL